MSREIVMMAHIFRYSRPPVSSMRGYQQVRMVAGPVEVDKLLSVESHVDV
jgi:hypothetical protein